VSDEASVIDHDVAVGSDAILGLMAQVESEDSHREMTGTVRTLQASAESAIHLLLCTLYLR
jgi:hypothetical protein